LENHVSEIPKNKTVVARNMGLKKSELALHSCENHDLLKQRNWQEALLVGLISNQLLNIIKYFSMKGTRACISPSNFEYQKRQQTLPGVVGELVMNKQRK
jgi:hypothetical protein